MKYFIKIKIISLVVLLATMFFGTALLATAQSTTPFSCGPSDYSGFTFDALTQLGKPGEKIVGADTDKITLKAHLAGKPGTSCQYHVRIGFYYIKGGVTKGVDAATEQFHGDETPSAVGVANIDRSRQITFNEMGLKPSDAPIQFFAEAWDADGNKSIFKSAAVQVVQAPAATPPANSSAPGNQATTPAGNTPSNSAVGSSPNGPGLNCGDTFCNPVDVQSLPEFIIKIMRILLVVIGMISVVMIIYGGFTMVISQGSPDAVKRGKQTIFWAIGGLVLALLSFSIVSIVQNLLGKK